MTKMNKIDGRERLQNLLHYVFNFGKLYEDAKHKSEICRAAFHHTRPCHFGQDCDFAHRISELCPRVFDHVNFKKQPCSNWKNSCSYGTRCLYLHDEKQIYVNSRMSILHSAREKKFRIIWDQGNGTVCAFTLDTDCRPKQQLGREVISSLWNFVKGAYDKVNPRNLNAKDRDQHNPIDDSPGKENDQKSFSKPSDKQSTLSPLHQNSIGNRSPRKGNSKLDKPSPPEGKPYGRQISPKYRPDDYVPLGAYRRNHFVNHASPVSPDLPSMPRASPSSLTKGSRMKPLNHHAAPYHPDMPWQPSEKYNMYDQNTPYSPFEDDLYESLFRNGGYYGEPLMPRNHTALRSTTSPGSTPQKQSKRFKDQVDEKEGSLSSVGSDQDRKQASPDRNAEAYFSPRSPRTNGEAARLKEMKEMISHLERCMSKKDDALTRLHSENMRLKRASSGGSRSASPRHVVCSISPDGFPAHLMMGGYER